MLTTTLELVLRFPPDGKAGLAVDTDNLVVRVTEGGAAAAAGLRVDDLIVKAGGKAVGGGSGRTAAQAIGEAKGELSIALSVTRATAKTAAAAAADAAAAASAAARQFDGGLTASMEAAAAQAAREGLPVLRLRLSRGDEGDLEGVGLTLKRGVVVVVFPRGLAERAGLQPGDRILKVNGDAFSAERLPPALSRGRPDILEVRRPLAPPSPSAAAGDDAAGGATAAGGTASSANKAASGKGSSATSSAAKRPPSAEPPPPHQGTAESTRAVVRVAAGRVEARWVATPCVARPTDVVVATLACAVSGGDVRAWQGQQQGQRQVGGIGGGGMIGEVVGEVVAVGSAVRSLKRGDMVALAPPSPSASQKASLAAAEAAEAAVAVVGAEEEAVVACQVGVLRVPDGERRLLKAPPNKGPPSSGTSTGTASGTRGRLTAAELLLASGPGAVGLAAADAVLGSTGGGGGSGGGGGFTYAVVGLGPTGLMAVASLLHRCRQAGKGGGAAGSKGGGAGGSVVVLGVDPLPHRRAAALALGATAAAAPEAAAGMLRDLISGEHGGGGAGDDDEVDWSSPENNDGARGGNGDGAATACGCDGVVEASGKAAGVALAVELLAYGGKLACVARHYDGGGGGGGAAAGAAAAVSLSVAACVDKAATVVFGRGSAHGSSAASNTAKASSAWSSAAAEAVEIAASGGFGANLEALVSHRLPLEEAQAAYQLAASGDGLRVMLYPSAPHAAGGGGGAAATGAAHGASAAAPKAVASPAMLASLD